VKRQESLDLYFGIGRSVFGFSTQDYLLRGMDALFPALLIIILTALAGLQLHAFLSAR
jgi:hypothetical protein